MRFKLDENIPTRLVGILNALGHDIDTVAEEGLTGEDDDRIWEAAQVKGRFLITQDLDFSDIRRFTPGTHHGLLLVRLREPGREALLQRLRWLFTHEDISSWHGCFIVGTDHKLRIRRPMP